MNNKWIGVDLDKTLATYDKWRGENHIGDPIPEMVDRVNQERENGKNFKVFTARASDPAQIPYIERWLEANGLGGLEVTNVKDYDMEAIWDDKAVQVDPNTGKFTLTITDDVDGVARQVTYTPTEVEVAEQFGHEPDEVYVKSVNLQKFNDLEDDIKKQMGNEPEPSNAQKESGRYKKAKVEVNGFKMAIENPKGSIRRGKDKDGNEWESKMHNSYGYFERTKGKDGDQIDLFLGPQPEKGKIFIVNQVNPKTKKFDEHKVMFGFSNEAQARKNYLLNYEIGWKGIGSIQEISPEELKEWSKTRSTKPFEPKKERIAANDDLTEEEKARQDQAHANLYALNHYDEAGIRPTNELVIYASKMDDVAREEHKDLNGQVFRKNSKAMRSCLPPADKHCRCEFKPIQNTDKRITNVVLDDYYHQKDKEQTSMSDIERIMLADDGEKFLDKELAIAESGVTGAQKLRDYIPRDKRGKPDFSLQEWQAHDDYTEYDNLLKIKIVAYKKVKDAIARMKIVGKRLRELSKLYSENKLFAPLLANIIKEYETLLLTKQAFPIEKLIELERKGRVAKGKINLRKQAQNKILAPLLKLRRLPESRKKAISDFAKRFNERIGDLNTEFLPPEYIKFKNEAQKLAKEATKEEVAEEKVKAKKITFIASKAEEQEYWDGIKKNFSEVVEYLLVKTRDKAHRDIKKGKGAKEIFYALSKSAKINAVKNKDFVRNLNVAINSREMQRVLKIGARLIKAAAYAEGNDKNTIKLYNKILDHDRKVAAGKPVAPIDDELKSYAKLLRKIDQEINKEEKGVKTIRPIDVSKKKKKEVIEGKAKRKTIIFEYKQEIKAEVENYNARMGQKGLKPTDRASLKANHETNLKSLKDNFKQRISKIPTSYSKEQAAVDKQKVREKNKKIKWVQDNIKLEHQKKILSLYSFKQMRNEYDKIRKMYPEVFLVSDDLEKEADPIKRMEQRLAEDVEPADLNSIFEKKLLVKRGDGSPIYNLDANEAQIVRSEIDRGEIKDRNALQIRLVGFNQDKSAPKTPISLLQQKEEMIAKIKRHDDVHFIASWMPSKEKWIARVTVIKDPKGIEQLSKYFNSAMVKATKTKTYSKGKRAADMTDEELLAGASPERKAELLKQNKEYAETEKKHKAIAIREAVRVFVSSRLQDMNEADRKRHYAVLNTLEGAFALDSEIKRRETIARTQEGEAPISNTAKKLNAKLNEIFSPEGKKEFVESLPVKEEPKVQVAKAPEKIDTQLEATRKQLLSRVMRAGSNQGISPDTYKLLRDEVQKAQTKEQINLIVQKLNQAIEKYKKEKAT